VSLVRLVACIDNICSIITSRDPGRIPELRALDERKSGWRELENMPEHHPDPALLERFLRNDASAGERRWIVRHLLAGCARCATVTRRVWNLGERQPDDTEEPATGLAPEPDLPEETREPALVAGALHRLALRLATEGGSAEDALEALGRARRLYGTLGDGPNLARLRHLEGKIAEGQGDRREAEAAFLDARRWCLGQGLGGEAAAVLFDLAILYTREGRVDEIRALAEDLLPIFQAGDLRKGVAAALVFFRQLVDTGQANLGLLTEVARFVSGGNRG
jgi:hypothetical protein